MLVPSFHQFLLFKWVAVIVGEARLGIADEMGKLFFQLFKCWKRLVGATELAGTYEPLNWRTGTSCIFL